MNIFIDAIYSTILTIDFRDIFRRVAVYGRHINIHKHLCNYILETIYINLREQHDDTFIHILDSITLRL